MSLTGGPGDDLLSHRWACSTMGAQGFHGRVRNGVGWCTLAVITRPSGQGACGWPAGRKGCAGWSGHGQACCLVEHVFKHGSGSLLEGGEFYRAIRIG